MTASCIFFILRIAITPAPITIGFASRKINPNTEVPAATASPEITSVYGAAAISINIVPPKLMARVDSVKAETFSLSKHQPKIRITNVALLLTIATAVNSKFLME